MAVEIRHLAIDAAEVRIEGRRLSGIAMPYGAVATNTPVGPERFAPGAFEGRADDVILFYEHNAGRPLARTGAGLVLTDTPEALRMAAELPETRDADDALTNVRAKIFRGLSVEFVAVRESRDGGIRVVEAAELRGIAVVTRPAYGDAEVAARESAERAEPDDGPPWWAY